jgi:hypothetical protein
MIRLPGCCLWAWRAYFWTCPPSVSEPCTPSRVSGLPSRTAGSFVIILEFVHDEIITTFFDDADTPTRRKDRLNLQATRRTRKRAWPAYETRANTITTEVTSEESRVVGLVPADAASLHRDRGAERVTFDTSGKPSVSGSPTILQDSVVCSSLTCHQSRDVRT